MHLDLTLQADTQNRTPKASNVPQSADTGLDTCGRCKRAQVSRNLRAFGDKLICGSCYQATLDLARGAISVMGSADSGRECRNCRALRDTSLGSAWCPVVELGDERARICANFVPIDLEDASPDLPGSRTATIDIWRKASCEIRQVVGDKNFGAWFDDVEPIEVSDGKLVLAVSNEFTRDWLIQRIQHIVCDALVKSGFPDLQPHYIVEPQNGAPVRSDIGGTDRQEHGRPDFNPRYTFEAFVVGSGNRLAHAGALRCLERPGRVFNPLVLHGGVGVGKTHLLQAMGQAAVDGGKGKVVYATAERFANELIVAIRDGSTDEFRARYRSVDFLLLDDIQFIAGKEATQEEIFHTFNTLHQHGKQVVFTSDRPPEELRILAERLRSRFGGGLTVQMEPPDLETRIAIVRSKVAIRGRRLPDNVLNAIAAGASENVRELEGALNQLFALADLMGAEPGMEIARNILGDTAGHRGPCGPSDVLQAVAAYFRVKVSELAGQHRERRVAYPRQIAMYLMREESNISLVEIGNQLGGRNHSTVIYSCEKVADARHAGRVKQDLSAIRHLMYARSA